MDALFNSSNVKSISLFRHGETEWTKSGQHTGRTDIPLTANGENEAILLGQSIVVTEFDHVLCSPLIRVQETCRLAGFDLNKVVMDDGLLEWDYGDYEGMTSVEIQKSDPNWTVFSKDPPGGETATQVKDRVVGMFERVAKLEGKVAFFGSGHITRVIGAIWLDQEPFFGQRLDLSTASKGLLGYDHDYCAIKYWNDTSHIK